LTARYATELAARYRFPRLGAGVIEALGDKHQLAGSAAAAGVPAPRHCSPTTEAELDAGAGELGWPVVVKARDTALLATTPGAKSVAIARDLPMLRTQWRAHLLADGPNCIVQEYIPGGPDTVWMVNAYYDASSTPRFAASGRKIRQHPPYTGATSLGRTERNEEVLALTERLVRHVGYRGILDIGWRFDARDGAYKVLDANPRIGATFRLFGADDGTDVVRAMRADLSGEVMPTGTVRDGRTWLNEPADLRTVRHYFADGALTLPAYLRSLTRVDECAWYAADDRAPMTPVLRDLARDVAGRVRIPRAHRARHRSTVPSVGR
jgi:D-aspartate ligase